MMLQQQVIARALKERLMWVERNERVGLRSDAVWLLGLDDVSAALQATLDALNATELKETWRAYIGVPAHILDELLSAQGRLDAQRFKLNAESRELSASCARRGSTSELRLLGSEAAAQQAIAARAEPKFKVLFLCQEETRGRGSLEPLSSLDEKHLREALMKEESVSKIPGRVRLDGVSVQNLMRFMENLKSRSLLDKPLEIIKHMPTLGLYPNRLDSVENVEYNEDTLNEYRTTKYRNILEEMVKNVAIRNDPDDGLKSKIKKLITLLKAAGAPIRPDASTLNSEEKKWIQDRARFCIKALFERSNPIGISEALLMAFRSPVFKHKDETIDPTVVVKLKEIKESPLFKNKSFVDIAQRLTHCSDDIDDIEDRKELRLNIDIKFIPNTEKQQKEEKSQNEFNKSWLVDLDDFDCMFTQEAITGNPVDYALKSESSEIVNQLIWAAAERDINNFIRYEDMNDGHLSRLIRGSQCILIEHPERERKTIDLLKPETAKELILNIQRSENNDFLKSICLSTQLGAEQTKERLEEYQRSRERLVQVVIETFKLDTHARNLNDQYKKLQEDSELADDWPPEALSHEGVIDIQKRAMALKVIAAYPLMVTLLCAKEIRENLSGYEKLSEALRKDSYFNDLCDGAQEDASDWRQELEMLLKHDLIVAWDKVETEPVAAQLLPLHPLLLVEYLERCQAGGARPLNVSLLFPVENKTYTLVPCGPRSFRKLTPIPPSMASLEEAAEQLISLCVRHWRKRPESYTRFARVVVAGLSTERKMFEEQLKVIFRALNKFTEREHTNRPLQLDLVFIAAGDKGVEELREHLNDQVNPSGELALREGLYPSFEVYVLKNTKDSISMSEELDKRLRLVHALLLISENSHPQPTAAHSSQTTDEWVEYVTTGNSTLRVVDPHLLGEKGWRALQETRARPPVNLPSHFDKKQQERHQILLERGPLFAVEVSRGRLAALPEAKRLLSLDESAEDFITLSAHEGVIRQLAPLVIRDLIPTLQASTDEVAREAFGALQRAALQLEDQQRSFPRDCVMRDAFDVRRSQEYITKSRLLALERDEPTVTISLDSARAARFLKLAHALCGTSGKKTDLLRLIGKKGVGNKVVEVERIELVELKFESEYTAKSQQLAELARQPRVTQLLLQRVFESKEKLPKEALRAMIWEHMKRGYLHTWSEALKTLDKRIKGEAPPPELRVVLELYTLSSDVKTEGYKQQELDVSDELLKTNLFYRISHLEDIK